MSDHDKDEDDEFTPTPEQTEAYRQRCMAAIGLGRFDKFCAGLHSSQLQAHTTQPNCVVVSVLGKSMAVVEYGDGEQSKVGIAVPPLHASWLNTFPFDFICATAQEIFFISKGFRWLNEDISAIGISLGAMIPTELLAKMCNQASVSIFMVDGENLANPKNGELLRDGSPVNVYQAQDAVPLFETKNHRDRIHRESNFDSQSNLHSHFVG